MGAGDSRSGAPQPLGIAPRRDRGVWASDGRRGGGCNDRRQARPRGVRPAASLALAIRPILRPESRLPTRWHPRRIRRRGVCALYPLILTRAVRHCAISPVMSPAPMRPEWAAVARESAPELAGIVSASVVPGSGGWDALSEWPRGNRFDGRRARLGRTNRGGSLLGTGGAGWRSAGLEPAGASV